MKLVTFRTESEGVRHGVLRGDAQTGSVVDLGPGDLLSLIEDGPSGLERARDAKGREMDVGSVRLLAPLRRPPKLLALARNYQDHITEGGGQPVDKQRVVPKLFLKPSSAIIGPDEPLCLPSVSNTTDWEVELAVVIGRRGRDVSMSDALHMVFGYTIANDVSARTTEWGVERDPDVWNDFFDWLCGKWPDGFAPLGPYVLTADEVPDPQTLDLSLYLNGERKQSSNTREMISTVAETIVFASRFMTLEPGDIIETGTPSGVGATTGTYVQSGDVMEARIETSRLVAHARRVTFDLLIQGGTLVDGTGAPAVRADVGIRGDRIVAIGDLRRAEAARRIDAQSRVGCPGFIDAHSHSDLTLLSDGRGLSKVHQGVTTEIVGNCGLGVAPLADDAAIDDVRSAIFLIDPDPAVDWSWTSMAGYLARVESSGVSLNVAALAGHLGIHASVMGYANRLPTSDETRGMQRLLDEALDQGAIGLSTGLMYAPISYAQPAELVALGEVVKSYDRVFAMHMRNYADHLVEAVDEAIQVGKDSGCRIQASHLCVVGQRNWGTTATALEHMDRARADGVRLRADIYPYLAGSANLSQLLPNWAHEGGTQAMVERLRSPADRERITNEWKSSLVQRWEDVLICWVRPGGDEGVVGKRISDIAAERHTEPDVAALDLIAAEEGLINMIAFGRSDVDLETVLLHPDTLIGSDGLAVDPHGPSGSGHPHPRYYGCYPRLLGRYVREQPTLTLEAAVHRATGLVADTFGIRDRGVLEVGRAADVVMFDPVTVIDEATFLEPQRFPTGIGTVVVNGTLVVEHGEHTNARPGRVLRGGG